MIKIKPFRAVTYNQEKIKNLSDVVCPPYDIISTPRQQYYHDLSPYNFIHILLGKDIPGEDKYQRASHYFKSWLKDNILIQDERPAIYFYSQQYSFKGEKKTRLGLIALLHLDDRHPSIFGHESTRLEPKEDRLRLLKAVKANLSPIFAIFSDKRRLIQRIYQQHIQDNVPFINVVDDEKTIHKLWRLDSVDILAQIQSKVQDEVVFIADGHHRYEVACAYRDQMQKRLKLLRGDEDFNYILTYFTNTTSHALTVLPIHRLVKLPLDTDRDNFVVVFKDYFDIEETKDKIRLWFLMEKAGYTEHVIGIYWNKKFWLLRLRNIKILDKILNDKPPAFRSLDVSIFNYLILNKILGLNPQDQENIIFSHNSEELIAQVNRHISYAAFFLNPAKINQIVSVALTNHKMPAKSTYFYPKVLSGLVINKFNEDKS